MAMPVKAAAAVAVAALLALGACGGETTETLGTKQQAQPDEEMVPAPATAEAAEAIARNMGDMHRATKSYGCRRRTLGQIREWEHAEWQERILEYGPDSPGIGEPGPDDAQLWSCLFEGDDFGDGVSRYARVTLAAEELTAEERMRRGAIGATFHKTKPSW